MYGVRPYASVRGVSGVCRAFLPSPFFIYAAGELAQLARASALQAEGQGFEPPILHNVPQAEAQGTDDLIHERGKDTVK